MLQDFVKLRSNNIMGYQLDNDRRIYVLADGRLINLATGDGHPAEIMDMSFQFEHCLQNICGACKEINRKADQCIKRG